MTNFLNRLILMLACLALAVYLTDSVNIVIPTFIVVLLSLASQLVNKSYLLLSFIFYFYYAAVFHP
ncbi:MAG: hypothetical protein GX567_17055 [Clostridia bacterium]|nr:hypothetical protein [Clostridia bacterium]